MLKRILACSFILAALPLLTSSAYNRNNPVPFQSTVFAGHAVSGGGMSCECGCTDCICDPGEPPGDCTKMNRVTQPDAGGAADRVATPKGKAGHTGFDFGSSALMLVMALWLWARLRA